MMESDSDSLPPTVDVVAAQRIVVHFDRFDEHEISGWAYDEANLYAPTPLILRVDGAEVVEFTCDRDREDVHASGFPSARVGFKIKVPSAFCDGEPHRVTISARERVIFTPRDADETGAPMERELKLPRYAIQGRVDGYSRGSVIGWVIVTDNMTGASIGGQEIVVRMNGRMVGQLVANEFRGDVAKEYDCDPRCGFVFVPPQRLLSGANVEFSFEHYPSGFMLGNSPYRLAFPEMAVFDELKQLEDDVDALFAKIWHLRSALKGLNHGENFHLASYDAWARQYFPALSALAGRFRLPAQPLVSIVCPCYRPRLKDLEAAVESVRAQSYPNWELIVVDDAGGDEAVTLYLSAAAAADSRIKFIVNPVNLGIGDASNVALEAARGDYIALFDHDDLLVDVALEAMVSAALATGASVLYSDEDKIDDDDIHSEPHLKPDWNYRLLLSQNYVCHLFMFKRQLLHRVGGFNAKYNGAQDHDLIIRLTENLAAKDIVHIPEILYHWRKTPQSTAQSGAAKPYAVEAGRNAILDHLARKNVAAHAESLFSATLYSTVAHVPTLPEITIIIPYNERISMTRACVESIFNTVSSPQVSIILVDNWSTSQESRDFIDEMIQHKNVTVVRVEEPFNYSRLNNIAARYATSEFLLFLNNDVILYQPGWLEAMVAEFIIDDKVGIVGNRLFYPNETNQHAGVILGVGGVADHAFKGHGKGDPGYCARAICSQNLSAVTAASMLIRRRLFEQLGGFDEKELRVAFNDIDLCLRARANGYLVTYTAAATGIHYESLSRGSDFAPARQAQFFHEDTMMLERWRSVIEADPYYNPHFSRQSGIYQNLAPPRPTAFTLNLVSSH